MADQFGFDLIAIAVQRDGRGHGDPAMLGTAEGFGKVGGPGDGDGSSGHPPLERFLLGLAVDAAVVDVLDPGGEEAVHLREVLGLAADLVLVGGDLDGELPVHGAEQPLDLPASFRASRGGVHQIDAEFRAGPQEERIDERAAVVDVSAASSRF
ncbi:hypothetical protein [Streptomyces sp. NPDC003480]